MPESNEIMSVDGMLVGMPLAGPETFTAAQIEYLKRAMGIDETVLFENSTQVDTFTTSEAIENFSELKVIIRGNDSTAANPMKAVSVVIPTAAYSSSIAFSFLCKYSMTSEFVLQWCAMYNRSGNTFTKANCRYSGAQGTTAANGVNANVGGVYKVIGVHRISGGN